MNDHIAAATPKEEPVLSNNVYDKLKQVAQIWLPALAVFYITIAPFWDLPKPEEVSGTLMALDLLLGTGLLVLSRVFYNSDARFDGAVLLEPREDGNTDLRFQADPKALMLKEEVTLKIVDLQ